MRSTIRMEMRSENRYNSNLIEEMFELLFASNEYRFQLISAEYFLYHSFFAKINQCGFGMPNGMNEMEIVQFLIPFNEVVAGIQLIQVAH